MHYQYTYQSLTARRPRLWMRVYPCARTCCMHRRGGTLLAWHGPYIFGYPKVDPSMGPIHADVYTTVANLWSHGLYKPQITDEKRRWLGCYMLNALPQAVGPLWGTRVLSHQDAWSHELKGGTDIWKYAMPISQEETSTCQILKMSRSPRT